MRFNFQDLDLTDDCIREGLRVLCTEYMNRSKTLNLYPIQKALIYVSGSFCNSVHKSFFLHNSEHCFIVYIILHSTLLVCSVKFCGLFAYVAYILY